MGEPRSIRLSAQGLTLHALDRNAGGDPPLLFCHGWLDHCHSFDWVCEALPNTWRMVQLDFRGHGTSEWQASGTYQLTELIADIDAALDGCGLPTAHLVGHSMGGTGVTLYAAARPERVRSLTLIENVGPLGGPSEGALERLRQFALDLNKPRLRRLYASLDDAIAKVRANNASFSTEAARHMTVHGVRSVGDGFEFSFDPALRRKSGLSLDDGQIASVLKGVRAPVQIIRGSRGATMNEARLGERLAALRNPPVHVVEGGHHVHLDSPREVARLIEAFVGG